MIDSLALFAIISDPDTAKKRTTATIDSQNPKRMNIGAVLQVSGNTNVMDAILQWGFYYGQAAVVG
jgi:hypothetical protein